MQSKYQAQRASFIERLGGKCVHCSSITCLEFDHIDPEQKSFDVGALFGKKKLPAVYAELDKCQLLCHDCHSAKTSAYNTERMKKHYQAINGEDGFRHGTVYSFMRIKCSCLECEAFKRQWNTDRNERRRGTADIRGTYKPRRPGQKEDAPVGFSWCRAHQQFLPTTQFTRNAKANNGIEYDCAECRSKSRSPHLWCATRDLNSALNGS